MVELMHFVEGGVEVEEPVSPVEEEILDIIDKKYLKKELSEGRKVIEANFYSSLE